MKTIAALLATGVFAVAGSASANLIVNGSFSAGTGLADPLALVSGTSAAQITGWTVTSGDVDWIGNYWPGSDGYHSLDMSGFSRGTIQQTVTVTPGEWELTFDLSGNYGDPVDKVLYVAVTGAVATGSQTYTFIQAGGSAGNMGWTPQTFTFTASGTGSIDVIFSSLGGTSSNPTYPEAFGPLLDNVSLVSVPEPVTIGIVSMASLLLMKRRRV